ncbi:MAG TPA: hypothetical protein VNK41_02415 [Vicinamibacterales bacterium]|nr:hypothetical protein [Vicinamibacterales bacterium]
MPTPVRDSLRAALLESRNPDGGWGYRAGKKSRIEPTSFALIALAGVGRAQGPAPTDGTSGVEPGLDAPAAVDAATVFERFERRDGLLIDPGATHPNIAFNGVAALAALYPPLGARGFAAELLDVLVKRRGAEVPPSPYIVQDNTLIGWPWLDGNFAWVEPTAWCLLALKKRIRETQPDGDVVERIDQAERLLRDRMCRGGGWNYGNRLVMDKSLRPYASTTALGLLAMQDRPEDAAVKASREVLKRLCDRERSGYALALGALAFARLGMPNAKLESALVDVWQQTGFAGDVVPTALALYVVEGRESGYEAFRI